MATVVYILGTLVTLLCTILLLRGYVRGRKKLLLWSGLCFAGLTVSNILLFVDLVLLPTELSLHIPRLATAAGAMMLLLYGLVWGERVNMLEGFLLGVIVTASLTAGVFFLKFWKHTRDSLFLAFAAAFIIEGLNRIGFLFVERPNEGSPAIYTVRLLAFLIILAAIVRKNRGGARQ